jgi:hypothetical protein
MWVSGSWISRTASVSHARSHAEHLAGLVKMAAPFPDDSRKWNAYGGIIALMEDGDLPDSVFAIKRLKIDNGQ